MNLPRQMLVYQLLHIGKFMRGRVGEGGLSTARYSPLSLTLSAHTLAGDIKRISYVSRGKCTGERGPNALLLIAPEKKHHANRRVPSRALQAAIDDYEFRGAKATLKKIH